MALFLSYNVSHVSNESANSFPIWRVNAVTIYELPRQSGEKTLLNDGMLVSENALGYTEDN